MNDLHCCAQILGVLLFIPWSLSQTQTENQTNSTESNKDPIQVSYIPGTPTSSPASYVAKTSLSPPAQQTTKTAVKATTTTTATTPTTTSSILTTLLQNPKLILIYAVSILVCAILLISTLALTLKVCQLRRRLKTIGSDSECWMGMDKTKKPDSQPEAKESCSLLIEDGKTNQEIDDSAKKDEGGKVSKDLQNGDEKKVEGAKESEEAAKPAAPEDSSPSPNPEEKTTISETTISETTIVPPPPSSSESTGEPKKEP